MKLNYLWTFLIPILVISCSSDNSDVTNIADENNPDDGGTVAVDPNKVLSLITNETVGSNCPNGGFKVELGIDTNGNGVLDADEITNTDFVCNGIDGQAGDQGLAGIDGKSTLISSELEIAGPNCESGGIKINIGLDVNGNNMLDTSEITIEEFICNGTDGSGATGGITNLVLTGNITNEEAQAKIDTRVGPDTQFVIIRNTTNLTSINLSGMTEAVDIDIQNNKELLAISFPDLELVIDKIEIEENPKLTNITVEKITTASSISYSNNALLTTIEMPVLGEVFEDITINNNSSLNSLSLPVIEKASIFISNNNLSSVNLPSLLSGFVNLFSEGITSIDLPSYVNGGISLNDTNLTSLNIPLLRESDTGVFFSDNSATFQTNENQPIDSGGDGSKGRILVENNNSFESFSFPLLTKLESIDIRFSLNSSLRGIDFSNAIGDNTLVFISGNNLLEEINFSQIISARMIRVSGNENLVMANFSNLETVTGSVQSFNDGIALFGNKISLLEFPKLREVGSNNYPSIGIKIQDNAVSTVNLPVLESVFNLRIFLNPEPAKAVSLPSIRNFNDMTISGITSQSTNTILSQLVSIVPVITGKSINISDTPTGQGAIDAESLRNSGNTVN